MKAVPVKVQGLQEKAFTEGFSQEVQLWLIKNYQCMKEAYCYRGPEKQTDC